LSAGPVEQCPGNFYLSIWRLQNDFEQLIIGSSGNKPMTLKLNESTKPSEEEKVRKAFKPKSWNEMKTYDSGEIFKVIAEFVEGFEKLARMGPCVSIFGSARATPGSP
jgi:hypothetical protein